MDLRFFRPSGDFSLSTVEFSEFFSWRSQRYWQWRAQAALITICILGPTSLASISAPWALAFSELVVVGYRVVGRLSGSPRQAVY